MSKFKWKKQVKGKIGKLTKERTKQEMANKTKARTIVEDQQERKKYFQECDSDTINDVIKIRQHLWQVNCNYKMDNTDTKCPLCKKSEDSTEHVLEREKAKNFTLSKGNSKRKLEEITEIYRKNKKKREPAVIKVQDLHKTIKESGKKKMQNKKNKTERKKQKNKGRQKIEKLKIQKRRIGG